MENDRIRAMSSNISPSECEGEWSLESVEWESCISLLGDAASCSRAGAESVTELDVETAQRELGCVFPFRYRNVLLQHGGEKPQGEVILSCPSFKPRGRAKKARVGPFYPLLPTSTATHPTVAAAAAHMDGLDLLSVNAAFAHDILHQQQRGQGANSSAAAAAANVAACSTPPPSLSAVPFLIFAESWKGYLFALSKRTGAILLLHPIQSTPYAVAESFELFMRDIADTQHRRNAANNQDIQHEHRLAKKEDEDNEGEEGEEEEDGEENEEEEEEEFVYKDEDEESEYVYCCNECLDVIEIGSVRYHCTENECEEEGVDLCCKCYQRTTHSAGEGGDLDEKHEDGDHKDHDTDTDTDTNAENPPGSSRYQSPSPFTSSSSAFSHHRSTHRMIPIPVEQLIIQHPHNNA